jgi:ubiquinone/menaquinone biosynthesis C-methylase UbiE
VLRAFIRTGSGSDRPETQLEVILPIPLSASVSELNLWPVATAPGSDAALPTKLFSFCAKSSDIFRSSAKIHFMQDPLSRFSNRVENYARYRPGYPAALIDTLRADCELRETSIVADVGSGTGILSELFLKHGNRVFGVEPNAAMRDWAEQKLADFAGFVSVPAKAEATTLPSHSIDFITAAQAFHWFERQEAKQEFMRILKPEGWVVIIWNERRLDSTPFLRDYEELLLHYGTDYQEVRHENVKTEIAEFFAPASFELKSLKNLQHCDLEELKGRICSASYTPEPGSPNFEPMIVSLNEIFKAHQSGGIVTIEYDTNVYYGRMTA